MKQIKKSYILVFLSAIISLGSCLFLSISYIKDLYHANIAIHEPKLKDRQAPIALTNANVDSKSVLIVGLDAIQNKKDKGRTDTMMIATLNPKTNKVMLFRIPRDMYIKTEDYEGKLNGLYAKVGMGGLINTIQDYFGVPISNYVRTDFKGVKKIVDSVGGVDIDSKIKIDQSNNENLGGDVFVSVGNNHMDGKTALGYSRIRYIDNDIERGNRQMQVVKALIKKEMSPNQLIKINENAKVISQYVKTDVNITDVIRTFNSLNGVPDVTNLNFGWDTFKYENQDFVYLKEGERQKISRILRESLGIEPLKVMSSYSNKPKE